jgi:hypothetical protein
VLLSSSPLPRPFPMLLCAFSQKIVRVGKYIVMILKKWDSIEVRALLSLPPSPSCTHTRTRLRCISLTCPGRSAMIAKVVGQAANGPS